MTNFSRSCVVYKNLDNFRTNLQLSSGRIHTWKTNTNNGINMGRLVDGDNEN